MKQNNLVGLSAAVLMAAFGSASARADIVFVTSTCSNVTATSICGSAINPDLNPNTGWAIYSDTAPGYTSAKTSGVTDKPVTPGGRYWTTGWSNATVEFPGVIMNPALGTPGGVYKVFHVFSSTAGNVNKDAIVGFTNIESCTLSFTQSDKFQSAYGQPAPQQWQYLGLLTNDAGTSNPKIGMYHVGGTVNGSGTGNRLIVDTFKFVEYTDPCIDVAPVTVKMGPLVAGQTTVVVSDVATNATAVTVYQNSGSGFLPIGTKTSGVTAGNNTVTVSALVKGAKIGATQTVGGQEGCVPTGGVIVGGGQNPRIRIALSVKEAPNATGPVGADGRAYTTNQARIHYIGATTIMPGAGPADGKVIQPANAWQTVTFQRGPDYLSPIDPTVIWNSNVSGEAGTQNDLQGDWGTIESIALAIDDTTDTGPFRIYIDNLMNGTNFIEDFEGAPAGTANYTFRVPSYSGTTAGYMLGGDVGVVDNTVYDTGSKSMRVEWQWSSLDSVNWVRFNTYNVTMGKANPMFYMPDPVSFRILIQPQGATPITNAPVISSLSHSRVGDSVVLNWSGAHRLQTTSSLTGTWTNVPQVILSPNTNTFFGPWTNTFTEPVRFFRLVD